MSWKNKPFLLKPVGKDYLWGGTRLRTDFDKGIDMTPLSETWECSTHPDGPSIADSGEHQGKTLPEILKEHPEYLGSHPTAVLQSIQAAFRQDSQPETAPQLPVLIKLIDAAQDLSVQVHPDDAYAQQHEKGSLGKTEMWYVLDAASDSKLVYGFNRDMDAELVRRSLEQGNIEKYLQKVPIQKDDVFYIESGTVHALGAGALVAEVQENSNLTYRLYDYGRRDKNGKQRELHLEKALEVLNYKSSDRPRQPMRVLRYTTGCASELLCRCKYFQVERLLINTEVRRSMADCSTGSNSFQVLLCLDGCGMLIAEGAESLPFFKGSCIFLPADSIPLKLHGKAQFLRVHC